MSKTGGGVGTNGSEIKGVAKDLALGAGAGRANRARVPGPKALFAARAKLAGTLHGKACETGRLAMIAALKPYQDRTDIERRMFNDSAGAADALIADLSDRPGGPIPDDLAMLANRWTWGDPDDRAFSLAHLSRAVRDRGTDPSSTLPLDTGFMYESFGHERGAFTMGCSPGASIDSQTPCGSDTAMVQISQTEALHATRMADNTYRLRKVRTITSGKHAGREFVESEVRGVRPDALADTVGARKAEWFN
jgi:hypothetical protein